MAKGGKNMKMMKKPVSVLLAVMMVFGIFASLPISAGAAVTSKTKTGGGPGVYVIENGNTTAVYNWDGVDNDAFKGISYDVESNTLTVTEGSLPEGAGLRIYMLGKDFKLNILGKISSGLIELYDTCLNIVGSGMLEVNNADGCAVEMKPFFNDYYDFTIDVSDSVSAVFNGRKAAVHITGSTLGDADNIVTRNGHSVGSFTRELQEEVNERVRCAEVKEKAYYLAENSEEEGIFGIEKDSYDNFEGELRFVKLSYDKDADEYSIDKSYSSSMSGGMERDEMLEFSDFSPVKNDSEEFVEVLCNYTEIWDFDVYTDSQGNKYGVDRDDNKQVFGYDENVTVEYEGENLFVCERNEDVDVKNLTAVTTSCYEYTSSDAKLSVLSEKRGAAAAIYLDADEQFSIYDVTGVHNGAVANVSYNEESNTLTLNNASLNDYTLTTYYMGSDFTLEIKGACALKSVVVYDGSLNVRGSGTLTVSGADYGISVEPLGKDYFDSALDFADGTGLDVNGSVSAFRVSGTTFGEASAVTLGKTKAVEGVYQKGSVTTESARFVKGATLSEWTGGVGYRYKVVKDDDPDHVYCAQISTTTHMDEYGRPSYSVTNYDMMKCIHDELSGRNLIVSSMGDMDSSEFEEGGYHLIESETSIAGYVLMSCYYVNAVSAEAYTDGSTLYAVNGEDVYSYSEDKKVTSNGKAVYLFESESVDASELTEVKDEFTYYNHEYNGARFTQEIKPVPTEATEATTAQPTQSVEVPTQSGEVPTQSGEVPTQSGEVPTQTGENPTQPTQAGSEPSEINPTQPDVQEATVAPATAPATVKPSSTVKAKKANPVKVSVKKKTVKKKKLGSKKQKLKMITVKKAKGAVTFKLVKSGTSAKIRKKVTVGKNGFITFKKGKYPKGSFKVTVKVNVKGNSSYKGKSVTVVLNIKIK